MALKLGTIFDWIRTELPKKRPVADSMSDLIDLCEAGRPHPDWTRLRTLPYADLNPLTRWIEAAFRDDPPDFPLKGLWFGLCNPILEDGNAVADLRGSGAERYDPTDNMWAVNAPHMLLGVYARSAVLAGIHRIGYPPGISREERKSCLGNDAEYPLCLGYSSFALRAVLSQLPPALILGESDSVGVMVGFNSGDFLHLAMVTASGLE